MFEATFIKTERFPLQSNICKIDESIEIEIISDTKIMHTHISSIAQRTTCKAYISNIHKFYIYNMNKRASPSQLRAVYEMLSYKVLT